MKEDLLLRRYESGDGDRIRELHEKALWDAGAYVENATEFETDLDAIPETYFDGGESLVGLLDGTIIAMGGIRSVDKTTAELERMRVDPTHQQRGYGERILLTLEIAAREQGFERIVLDTTDRQTAAKALYRKHGYEETTREPFREFEMVFVEKRLE